MTILGAGINGIALLEPTTHLVDVVLVTLKQNVNNII